jgi:hypothetical protein
MFFFFFLKKSFGENRYKKFIKEQEETESS